MTHHRVLGVIPARYASSRFPGKVLASLDGNPLIQHVYERLAAASLVDHVVVATDSHEVEEAVASFGGDCLFVAGPYATGTDRVAAAVAGLPSDIVVNLQGDQPRIEPGDIDRLVAELDASDGWDLTTLAFPASDLEGYESRDVVKVVADQSGRALYFSRAPVPSSKEPPSPDEAERKRLYLHHVGIYCFRRAAIERFASLPRTELEARESLEQLRALENGMSIGVVVTDRASRAVDREADLVELEGTREDL